MSFYSNVAEKDLINLRKLAKQQKKQRTEKIKNIILKQTHVVKLSESFSPMTKKLDEVNKSTQEYVKSSKNHNHHKTIKLFYKILKVKHHLRKIRTYLDHYLIHYLS